MFQYIHWLEVTKEYTFIFLGTDEYNDIYSSTLYSSVTSSVNREIRLSVIEVHSSVECFVVSYSDISFVLNLPYYFICFSASYMIDIYMLLLQILRCAMI
jgi:hypothetical protein